MRGITQRDIIKISYLYYTEKKTQEAIAALLDLSRFKVSRILKKAIDDGIVSITINDPMGHLTELEVALAKKFGLKEAVVVSPLNTQRSDTLQQVAMVGAGYLQRIINGHRILGVTWGRTLRQMINSLAEVETGDLAVVQLSGGMGSIEGTDANILTMMLSQKLDARPYVLQAPAVVRDKQTKDALLQEISLVDTLSVARQADLSLVGIGLVSRKGLLYTSGLMQEDDYNVLQQNGAVGAICGRCFDIEGKPCINSWDDRVVGLTLEELKQIKHKVGIAFGTEKIKAITGALNGRYLDVLITDEAIARQLLSR